MRELVFTGYLVQDVVSTPCKYGDLSRRVTSSPPRSFVPPLLPMTHTERQREEVSNQLLCVDQSREEQNSPYSPVIFSKVPCLQSISIGSYLDGLLPLPHARAYFPHTLYHRPTDRGKKFPINSLIQLSLEKSKRVRIHRLSCPRCHVHTLQVWRLISKDNFLSPTPALTPQQTMSYTER